jgi:Ser-tRNA(Ala) deacylase AlaX
MQVLIDNELHKLEFSETDFKLSKIKIRNDRNLIDYQLSQQKDTAIYFQDLRDSLGIGVLVSVPYSEKEIRYIDFQLIDWNVDCGTGNYFRKEMK